VNGQITDEPEGGVRTERRPTLPDVGGDVTVALTPRQLAFLALIAALILAVLRRAFGRRDKAS
jgi:hypothetical protein